MKLKSRIIAILLVFSTLIALVPFSVFGATETTEVSDAMKDINSSELIKDFKIDSKPQYIADDGYIGIPVEITVFYSGNTPAVPGYNGTPIIMYIVNSGAERVGRTADDIIIKSMLDRGYAVAVVDYKNNVKAVPGELEFSATALRLRLRTGEFFTNKTKFPAGEYMENHVVPAGHNISPREAYYEIDKHGTDGAIERIVEVWNYDFRATSSYAETVIKWTDMQGNRKSVQNGFDGTTPVWYTDDTGSTVDNENGTYIKIKHTWAKKITDCTKKDGSPLDFELYMLVIYPDDPAEAVPVMTLSSSRYFLADSHQSMDRAQLLRYAFTGYAVSSFECELVPMCRFDHYGYFDGGSGVTGINGTFTVGTYSRNNNTAAMRYLRKLALDPATRDTYKFDTNAFGIFGNSKGAFQTYLGSEELRNVEVFDPQAETVEEFISRVDQKVSHIMVEKCFVVQKPEIQNTTLTPPSTVDKENYMYFDGDTRYQNGCEAIIDGDYVVEAGELQPNLVYTDENGVTREISSAVQWVYSACGGTMMHKWTGGHSPVFLSINTEDPYKSGYETINYILSLARTYDVPTLYFEVPIEHAFTYGDDLKYGVDTYEAMIKSSDYYLKNDPVSVVYTSPANGDAGVRITDGITVKFYGPVSLNEIKKVEIVSESGVALTGSWASSYGNTEWVFTPDFLDGSSRYTVNVPANLKGSNGKEMGRAYSYAFYTYGENVVSSSQISSPVTVNSTNGAYFTFTAPTIEEFDGTQLKLRFRVTNDAANTAQIYKVENTSDTSGTLIGEIQLSGAGYYEYDVTDYVMQTPGKSVCFLVKNAKQTSNSIHYKNDLISRTNLDFMSNGGWRFVTNQTIGGELVENALEAKIYPKYGQHGISDGYAFANRVLAVGDIIKLGNPVTRADYGRSFTVTIRYCDTTSRYMQLSWNTCNDSSSRTGDYGHERASTRTVANEWATISVNYTVYEMDYGVEEIIKRLSVTVSSAGGKESPIYFDSITVTENVTDTVIDSASLVEVKYGDNSYTTANDDGAFEYNGNTYATLSDALASADKSSDVVITLLRNYVCDSDAVISSAHNVVIDLNGHIAITSNGSLLNFNAADNQDVKVTVKNGSIIVSGYPVISHIGAASGVTSKAYDVEFENVFISTASGAFATRVVSGDDAPSGVSVTQTIKFTDSTVDVMRNDLPKTATVILPSGKNGLKSSYIFYGGSVRLTSFVTLQISENMGAVCFLANSEGNVTELITANSASVSTSLSVRTEDGYSLFAINTEAEMINGYDTYKVTATENSTKYGVIPDGYPAGEYPFAVFADGKFLAAYSMFSTASENIAALSAPALHMNTTFDKNVQILMRRDYTMSEDKRFSNLSRIDGTVTVDLGTHVMTLANGVPLVNMYAKPGTLVGTNSTAVFDTNLNFINGTVVTGKSKLVEIQSKPCNTDAQRAQYNKQKITNVVFDGVDIIGSTQLVAMGADVNLEKGSLTNIVFNGCELDLSAITSATTLFSGKDSADMNNLCVKFNGGNITAGSSVNSLVLSELDSGDSIYFEGGSTTLTLPNGTAPTWIVKNEENTLLEFSNATVGESKVVYALAKSTSLQTPYGRVPSSAVEANYEWLIFSEGSFIKGIEGTNCYTNAIDYVKINYPTATVQLLLMKDNTVINTQYSNFAAFTGNLTVDLNNYTITCNRALLFAYAKASAKTTNVTVINGTVKSGNTEDFSNVVKVESGTIANKVYNFNFENVKFVIPSGCQSIVATREGTNTNNQTVNLSFVDCTFDIQSTSAITVFETSDANGVLDIKMNFKGGSITAQSIDNTTLWTLDSDDSIIFNRSEKTDAYIELTLNFGKTAPKIAIPTDKGDMYFAGYNMSVVGTTIKTRTFRLGNKMLNGAYIPTEYEDTDAYPFAVFTDGELYACYTCLGDNKSDFVSALKGAHYLHCNSKSATILLRRNYITSTVSGIDNYYNLGGLSTGTLTLDLSGYSITSQRSTELFTLEAKTQAKAGTVTFNIKNGTFIVKNAAIFKINTNANCTTNNVFDINITNVNILYANPSGSLENVIAHVTGTNSAKIKTNITLDGCVIDLTAKPIGTSLTLFKMNDTTGHIVNVTVKGGKIIADTLSGVTVYTVSSGNEDSFTFVKDENGDYTKLCLTAKETIAQAFVTDDGERTFMVCGTDGNYFVYTLENGAFKIGDKNYATLEEAISNASAGDTVIVVANTQLGEVLLTNGVSLDINGKTVKADSLVVFSGSAIFDSVGSGFIDIPKDKLLISMTVSDYIAIYVDNEDDEKSGYTFKNVTDQKRFETNENGFSLVFRPSLNNSTALNEAMFGDGAKNNALDFVIRLADENGNMIREFIYTDSLIAEAYQTGRALKITVKNIPEEYKYINVTYVLISETGMKCVINAGVFTRTDTQN